MWGPNSIVLLLLSNPSLLFPKYPPKNLICICPKSMFSFPLLQVLTGDLTLPMTSSSTGRKKYFFCFYVFNILAWFYYHLSLINLCPIFIIIFFFLLHCCCWHEIILHHSFCFLFFHLILINMLNFTWYNSRVHFCNYNLMG